MNFFLPPCQPVKTFVLIDTWWNVNAGVWTIGYGHTGVLIDTWWNVNKNSRIAISNENKRFNRYMVECELTYNLDNYYGYAVLIDTWWNVNFI